MKNAPDDFTQRRRQAEGSSRARLWSWDENPRITIRERVNDSGGVGYRVTLS